MFDLATAHEVALRAWHPLDLSAARELREGWFFPYSGDGIGSSGVIVKKASGDVFVLGSTFPLNRDLRAYDEGFQFEGCDLIITAIRDSNATVEALPRHPCLYPSFRRRYYRGSMLRYCPLWFASLLLVGGCSLFRSYTVPSHPTVSLVEVPNGVRCLIRAQQLNGTLTVEFEISNEGARPLTADPERISVFAASGEELELARPLDVRCDGTVHEDKVVLPKRGVCRGQAAFRITRKMDRLTFVHSGLVRDNAVVAVSIPLVEQ